MNTALVIAVDDSSQVGEARRAANALGATLGMSDTERGHLALVVTEAGNNLVHHAGGGRILIQPVRQKGFHWIDVLTLDKGPGIRNVTVALRDGHSTAGTAGQGLGAVRRASSAFDMFSAPDKGTVLFSRIASEKSSVENNGPLLEWGVVSLPYPGETVCGDGWAVETGPGDGAARFVVVDGLGHGAGASEASGEALRLLDASAASHASGPAQMLQNLHAGLRHTRGAAAAIAQVEASAVVFAGVGNIQAALVTPENGAKGMASFNGTIGHQAHKFAELRYEREKESLLVMASDGLTTQWRLDGYPGVLNRHPAVIAGLLFRDFARGRDDATVLVARLSKTAPEEKLP